MDGDELAGIVDLFGGLTRSELEDALDELAFKRGDERAAEQGEAANGREGREATRERAADNGDPNDVDTALRGYYLVAVDGSENDRSDPLLAPGPVAFPELPEYGADLPHILDVERRDVNREELAAAVRECLESEAGDADGDRAEYLLDVTYDAEAWAPLELDDVRERLDVDS
jgi:hypothetical protein